MERKRYPCNRRVRSRRCSKKIDNQRCPFLAFSANGVTPSPRCALFLREKMECSSGEILIARQGRVYRMVNPKTSLDDLRKTFPGWNVI